MNHMRSIKEMLSIPTGSRNVSTSGYSSFTDSQVFFGSQFWQENSQGNSQDMSMSSRASQQSSQEIQQLVAGTERNAAVCQTVLQKFDNFASTMQSNLNSLQSDISQQFETLLNKVISHEEMMAKLEDGVQKSGPPSAEVCSNLQSLKSSLECQREEQERQRNLLEEGLKLLNTFVSEHSAKSSSERVTDSAIQTSPEPDQPSYDILQDNKLESTQLTRKSYNLEHNQAEVSHQDRSCITGKRKFPLSGHKRLKKRALVLSQRSKRTVTDENRKPLINCDKNLNVPTPLSECRDPNTVTGQNSLNTQCQIPTKKEVRSIAEGCLITPLSSWSQDSNSSECLPGVESILEKVSAESKTDRTPEKHEGLWQLFNMDCDFGFGF
ncbi:interactor of HORMAD1 protein 1 [Plectropomus leopardus]|uniref:interactor of HORMAD1 protein 1 n=1 Tax=Plectropomus leopardus TaxID=160734 RepID=UPI001C4C3887|nr:interactor of HORMAD1 protein 1 [Plectropomus leopardus]